MSDDPFGIWVKPLKKEDLERTARLVWEENKVPSKKALKGENALMSHLKTLKSASKSRWKRLALLALITPIAPYFR